MYNVLQVYRISCFHDFCYTYKLDLPPPLSHERLGERTFFLHLSFKGLQLTLNTHCTVRSNNQSLKYEKLDTIWFRE